MTNEQKQGMIPVMDMKKLIRQKNALTDARTNLTKQESNLLYLARWMISKTAEMFKSPVIDIDLQEYAKQFGVSNATASRDLKLAINGLFEKSIFFKGDNAEYHWLQSRPIAFGGGAYQITLSQRVFEYLTFPLNDNGNFTKLYLEDAKALKSVNALKLMELVRRFEFQHGFNFHVQDLYDFFDVSPSYRANFSDVERRIFKPAIKAIEKLGTYKVEIIKLKAGKKVSQVMFMITNKTKNLVEPETNGKEETPPGTDLWKGF